MPGRLPSPLTGVRGAAGEELRGGATAFLCQVNGHLYVLNPLFHLGPRTERKVAVRFSDHSRWKGRQVSGQGPGYLAATTTDCRWPRSVRQWGTPHSSSLSSICGMSVHNVNPKK